jgi:SMC interacting uncharacterized protein involved in chromosome segregation
MEDDLARFQEENHRLTQEIKQLKAVDETRSRGNAALRRASAKYADEVVAIKSKSRDRLPVSGGEPTGQC